MWTYIFPITTALISFPIIAFFFTFPFVIYQYRKHGYISKLRIFILYSMLLYLITAYYLVILPLPRTRDILSLQKPGTQYYVLTPFSFIKDIIKETRIDIKNPTTYIDLLKERAFLQAAFNAILLTPLGVYLRYYFNKDMKKTIIICFGMSLFFELTQLTGLYGYYNAPYRLFDVNDLILNTFGGFIGYVIEPIFSFFLPNAAEIDKEIDLNSIRVSYFRRFLAVSIDLIIISLPVALLKNYIEKWIFLCLYFIVLSYFLNGKTIGKMVVRIRVKGQNDRLTFKEVIKRYGSLYLGIFGLNSIFGALIKLNENTLFNHVIIIMFYVITIINLLLLIHSIIAILKKDKLFYEKISNTRLIIYKAHEIK